MGAIFLGAALPLGLRLFAGGLVGVDVVFDVAGLVHLAGVDLDPALGRGVVRAADESGAAHVGDVFDGFACGDAVRHVHQRAFGVAVEQQVALGVHHDAAAHLVAPVVVVGDAAQAAFDAAEHDGHVLVGLAAALAVDDGRAVGAFAAHVAGGVGVVAADLPVRRVPVDHGIHVARGHAPEQVGLAQRLEGFGALPVGLGDDADAKTLRLQHSADHRHAEAGVVDVGVAGHQHDVARVPAQLLHLGAAHGQERRHAEPLGPIRAVAGERFGGAREKGDVDGGVHGGQSGDNPQVYGLPPAPPLHRAAWVKGLSVPR